MADEEAAATDKKAEEQATGGSKKPLLIVGVVALLLGVGGGGAAAWFLGGSGEDAEDPAAAEAAAGEGAAATDGATATDGSTEAAGATAGAQVVSLGSFTVNLRDSAGGRLLQMEISVEGAGPAAALVAEREAQIRDAILMLASDYSFLELEGLDGKLRLRDEIHRRVNTVLAPEKVNRVYFTAFVVQ